MTASGGAAGVGRAVNEAVVIAFMGVFVFNYVFTQTLIATTNPETADDPVMGGWLQQSHADGWIRSGDIARFCATVAGWSIPAGSCASSANLCGRPEVLILGSTIVIWGLCFHPRVAVRDRGRVPPAAASARPPAPATFAAWCDLRELVPYAFGYMMAAKVGTGIVAELGSMRISDEIDALEVMGVPPIPSLLQPACWPPG